MELYMVLHVSVLAIELAYTAVYNIIFNASTKTQHVHIFQLVDFSCLLYLMEQYGGLLA